MQGNSTHIFIATLSFEDNKELCVAWDMQNLLFFWNTSCTETMAIVIFQNRKWPKVNIVKIFKSIKHTQPKKSSFAFVSKLSNTINMIMMLGKTYLFAESCYRHIWSRPLFKENISLQYYHTNKVIPIKIQWYYTKPNRHICSYQLLLYYCFNYSYSFAVSNDEC